MTKHRSHSAAFKRQVAEEFIAGETLHALSKQHDISRQLIRIWVGKFEAGALDEDVQASDLMQEYEAKIAALERLVGRQATLRARLPVAVSFRPGPFAAASSSTRVLRATAERSASSGARSVAKRIAPVGEGDE